MQPPLAHLRTRTFPRKTTYAHAVGQGLIIGAALCPVLFIGWRIFLTNPNIAFWDDLDSTLGFLLRFDGAGSWQERLVQLFALEAEHRTVTSRLIILVMHWLTGSVNFSVIGILGNLSLLGLCGLLISTAGSTPRRIMLGSILAFGIFHLELYEPFFWSGASIDHFLILILAGGAIVCLRRHSPGALISAGLLAALANFTLSHGCLAWAIGGVILGSDRRWRALGGWSAAAAVALFLFFHGFGVHSAHRFSDFSAAGLLQVGRYWLALLGGPLTFGAPNILAQALGFLLVVTLGWLAWRRGLSREPVVLPLALFAAGSLALIAFGRLVVAGPRIESRYLVLGSLAWSLAVYMLVARWSNPVRPLRLLAVTLPVLAGFNLAANLHAAPFAETFLISRFYPAVRYAQFGEDGHAGGFQLHPLIDTTKRILEASATRGLYHLPRFCERSHYSPPKTNSTMVTYITDITATDRAVGFEGWAMVSGRTSQSGCIRVVLRSPKSLLVFNTVGIPRPDVAKAFGHPEWRNCGYNFVAARDSIPRENFQIGLLIEDHGRSEIKMTAQHLDLTEAATFASAQ